MQQFINNIWQFLISIYASIDTCISNYAASYYAQYNAFLQKNVFLDNSLIGLNLTWKDLLVNIGIWFLVIIFIVIFIRFIFKILGLFKFNRFND